MANRTKVPDFKAMAELRYQIRRFLRFSENAARQAGIEAATASAVARDQGIAQ